MRSWTGPGTCLGQPSSCWSNPGRAEGEDRDPPPQPRPFWSPPGAQRKRAGSLCGGVLGREGEGSLPRKGFLAFLSHLSPLSSSFHCSFKVRNTQLLNRAQLLPCVPFIPTLEVPEAAAACLAGEKSTLPVWTCLWM